MSRILVYNFPVALKWEVLAEFHVNLIVNHFTFDKLFVAQLILCNRQILLIILKKCKFSDSNKI